MRLGNTLGVLLFAAGIAAACGGDDGDDEGTGGSGTGGSAAQDGGGAGGAGAGGTAGTGAGGTGVGASGGTSGGGTGATGTGATGTGATGTGATGTGATGATDSGVGGGTGGSAACVPATCVGKTYKCGNCLDDDGDKLIDMADPDCLGPCHNAEDTYYGSIPGQAGPACAVDCYFDDDSGSGNDNCYWDHRCDPLAVAPKYPPEGLDKNNVPFCPYNPNHNTSGTNKTCAQLLAAQSSTCENICSPLVPNGCDCFGCCELPAGGGKYVWLGSEDANDVPTCTLKDVADPTKCQPCTPVPACLNKCEHCELCLGKTTLPADCFPPPPDGGVGGTTSGGGGSPSGGGTTSGGGGSPSGGGTTSGGGGTSGSGGSCGGQICPVGKQPCGLSCQPPCAQGYFCLTGCCTAIPS